MDQNTAPAIRAKSAGGLAGIPLFLKIGIPAAVVLGLAAIFLLPLAAGKNSVMVRQFLGQGKVLTRGQFLVFRFDKPVVSFDKLEKPLNPGLLKISPALKGEAVWSSPGELTFRPGEQFKPGLKYRVTLRNALVSEFGKILRGRKTFGFDSEALKVVYANIYSVYEPSTYRVERVRGEIRLSSAVGLEALKKRLNLRLDAGPAVDLQVEEKEKGTVFSFTSALFDEKKPPNSLRLSLKPGLTSLLGGRGLTTPVKIDVSLDPRTERKVTDIRPIIEAGAVSLQLTFNMPVDASAAERFIEVSPGTGFEASASGAVLNLKGGFTVGDSYTVTVKEGFPGRDGSLVRKPQTLNVTVEDLPAEIDFINPGRYLPKNGTMKIGFTAVNVSEVHIEITKLLRNNILQYLHTEDYYYSDRYFTHDVISTNVIITADRNRSTSGYIDLSRYMDSRHPGLYRITLWQSDSYWSRNVMSVLTTDLGMSVKRTPNDMLVFVNRLSSLDSVEGAKVKVLSSDGQELLSGESGRDGFVHFPKYRAAIEAEYGKEKDEYQPYAVFVEKDGDLSYLAFERAEVNTSVFDTGGAPYNEGQLDAFVYTERGVYRPGEDVHVTAIVRNAGDLSVSEEMPLVLKVTGPAGDEFLKLKKSPNNGGVVSWTVPVASWEKTGQYTAEVMVGDEFAIGSAGFQVEDFMPNKIKVELSPLKETFGAGEDLVYTVKAVNLFGPPASGNPVRSEIRLVDEGFRPEKYRDYIFAVADRRMEDRRLYPESAVLDDEGAHTFKAVLPEDVKPAGLLRAVVYAEVNEVGGRPVAAVRSVRVSRNPFFLGIKKVSHQDRVGQSCRFSIVALDERAGTVKAKNVRVRVYMREWYSTSYYEGRRYRWKYEPRDTEILSKTLETVDGEAFFSFTPRSYSYHRVLVESEDGRAATELLFYPYDWDYETTMDLAEPGRLHLKLDKTVYKSGDTVNATIGASVPGLLLLTVEKDGVVWRKVSRMKSSSMSVSIPVRDDFGPNFYVTASVLRPYSAADTDKPMREFGIASARIDMSGHRLGVEVETPARMRPKTELRAKVKVRNATGRAYLTLMAVDEGICQITGFSVPDPFKYFTRKRALGVETSDTWKDVISDLRVDASMLAVGGDAFAESEDRRHVNPVQIKRVKPVSLWSGVVSLNALGEAEVPFKVPMFNGTLRVMAVACSADRFGSSEKMTVVSDPIVLTSSFPRFLAPDDRFTIPLSVYNRTGKDGTFKVTVSCTGPVAIEGERTVSVTVRNDREAKIRWTGIALKDAGAASFTVRAEGNGETSEETTELGVRPAGQRTSWAEGGRIAEGKSATFTVPSGVLGKPEVKIALSGNPMIRYAESLKALVGYPYGCLEQTTSKAMPMLFVKDILEAADPDAFKRLGGDYYVSEAVRKISRMVYGEYGFVYWPGAWLYYDYTTVYASHFLLEAKRKGFGVTSSLEASAFSFLRRIARGDPEERDLWGGSEARLENIVYALYVLAAYHKPERETMIAVRERHWNGLATHEQAMLAAAFAYSGDITTARKLMPKDFFAKKQDDRGGYGGFYSSTRGLALALDCQIVIDPSSPNVGKLVEALDSRMEQGAWSSTHENAFCLMALAKVYKSESGAKLAGSILASGKELARFNGGKFVFRQRVDPGTQVTVRMDPSSGGYYVYSADSFPLAPDRREAANGLRLNRRYMTVSGAPADLSALKQGDLVVVRIDVSSDGPVENIALVDMLPAGLEIENTRLQVSGSMGWLPEAAVPEYLDLRDDRVIFFTSLRNGGDAKFFYACRAVSAGSFVLPSLYAEAMYDTRINARTSTAERVTVTE